MFEINKRIKTVRQQFYGSRGKSALCKDLEVSETTYQGYEKKTDVPCSFIKKICEIKNINPEWILFGTEPMIKPLEKPGKTRPQIERSKLDRRSTGNLWKYLVILEGIDDGEIKASLDNCAKTLEGKIYRYLKNKPELEGK